MTELIERWISGVVGIEVKDMDSKDLTLTNYEFKYNYDQPKGRFYTMFDKNGYCVSCLVVWHYTIACRPSIGVYIDLADFSVYTPEPKTEYEINKIIKNAINYHLSTPDLAFGTR